MSRRSEDSKRYRSHFDRDPSPKRSRRDGKPATERSTSNLHSEVANSSDRDQKHNQRLRDALPLEAPPAPVVKTETGPKSKESERRSSEHREGIRNSSNATDAPRSRSYFQRDERDRHHGRGASTGGRDSKDQRSERASEKIETRGRRSETRKDDNHAWHHDGFYKMERDQLPPVRKRPAFRERKDEVVPGNAERTAEDPVKSETRFERGGERKELREGAIRGERDSNRRELQRGNFLEREMYNGSNSRRERFNGSRGYQQGGNGRERVEKWKHDLYEEDKKSPIRMNEDDYVAKVEALLAS